MHSKLRDGNGCYLDAQYNSKCLATLVTQRCDPTQVVYSWEGLSRRAQHLNIRIDWLCQGSESFAQAYVTVAWFSDAMPDLMINRPLAYGQCWNSLRSLVLSV